MIKTCTLKFMVSNLGDYLHYPSVKESVLRIKEKVNPNLFAVYFDEIREDVPDDWADVGVIGSIIGKKIVIVYDSMCENYVKDVAKRYEKLAR